MSVDIRAGYFHVICNEFADKRRTLCASYASSKDASSFRTSESQKNYCLTNATWHSKSKALTGTMWLLRESQLPARFKGARASALGLADDEALAEPASFAYMPDEELALIQYNHTGPRHSLLKGLLHNAGLTPPVTVSPLLTTDAVEQMENHPIIRKVEFALSNPPPEQLKALRKAGGAVKDALDAMSELEGLRICVTISMGQQPGALGAGAQALLEALINSGSAVHKLKMTAKDVDENAPQLIDLLGGRQTIDLSIREKDRELDHAQCRKRLLEALESLEY